MFHLVLVTVFYLVSTSLSLHAFGVPTPISEIRGCLKIKEHYGKMPQFRVLYEGKETVSNPEGFLSIPVTNGMGHVYSLLICKDIQQNFDKTNTVKDVSITSENNYRFLTYLHSPFGGQWVEDHTQERTKNFVIPEHCIVVLMDSTVLDKIEPWSIELDSKTLKLPMLSLKAHASPKTLERASARSLLKSLDSTSFYESIKEEIRKPTENPKVTVSLNK